MADVENVVGAQVYGYTGIFSAKDLYRMIVNYIEQLGYIYSETKNIENVKSDGKFIFIEMQPFKVATDYAKYVQHVKISIENLKNVKVTIDGVDKQMNEGTVTITVDSFLITDYETAWDLQPIYYLIRLIANRYLIQPVTHRWKREIERDSMHLIDNIKAFLNLSGKRIGA